MPTGPFTHYFRVALHDTDAAGVLFFAHLFRHAHDAYEAWMTQLGFPLDAMLRDGTLRLPLVHAEADYRQPLRHGIAVTVELEPAAVGTASFTVDYRFRTSGAGLAATARTVHAAMDQHGRRGLPSALREALAPRTTN